MSLSLEISVYVCLSLFLSLSLSLSLSLRLSQLRPPSSSALGPLMFLVLGPWIQKGTYTINLQFSGLQTQTELHQQLSGFSSLQTVLSTPITLWANSYNKFPLINIYIYPIRSVTLENLELYRPHRMAILCKHFYIKSLFTLYFGSLKNRKISHKSILFGGRN